MSTEPVHLAIRTLRGALEAEGGTDAVQELPLDASTPLDGTDKGQGGQTPCPDDGLARIESKLDTAIASGRAVDEKVAGVLARMLRRIEDIDECLVHDAPPPGGALSVGLASLVDVIKRQGEELAALRARLESGETVPGPREAGANREACGSEPSAALDHVLRRIDELKESNGHHFKQHTAYLQKLSDDVSAISSLAAIRSPTAQADADEALAINGYARSGFSRMRVSLQLALRDITVLCDDLRGSVATIREASTSLAEAGALPREAASPAADADAERAQAVPVLRDARDSIGRLVIGMRLLTSRLGHQTEIFAELIEAARERVGATEPGPGLDGDRGEEVLSRFRTLSESLEGQVLAIRPAVHDALEEGIERIGHDLEARRATRPGSCDVIREAACRFSAVGARLEESLRSIEPNVDSEVMAKLSEVNGSMASACRWLLDEASKPDNSAECRQGRA